MQICLKSLLLSCAVALCLPLNALAQDDDQTNTTEPDVGQVLANVNGTEITLGHVIAIRQALPPQYNQFPADLLFRAIMDQLVQHTLVIQSSDTEPSRRTLIEIENETRTLIATEILSGVAENEPSETELLELYDAEYPPDMDAKEYRASHILVETEDEAIQLITSLASGGDFAELAREFSTGPSGESGGDLGWFAEGDMVEPFFDAVEALSPGGVSAPVQTQFGWHVIRLAETRQQERPELETVQPELEQIHRQNSIDSYVAALREEANITETDLNSLDPSIIMQYELLEP
ncbi:MAG: peptidylprolyl isomerase [Pseudomonadota bacterium]